MTGEVHFAQEPYWDRVACGDRENLDILPGGGGI